MHGAMMAADVLDDLAIAHGGPVIPPPRNRQQRMRDTLHRLEHDIDAWVATADEAGGVPYLVPLSYLWDGETLLIATAAVSPTGRNLQATGTVRLGIGHTRDVVLVEATAHQLESTEVTDETGDAFAAKTGFDPRELTGYRYIRIYPQRVQAWREVDELADRDLMRDGRWLVDVDNHAVTAGDGDAHAPTPVDGDDPGPRDTGYQVRPVGWIASSLTDRDTAPRQGDEGAPPAQVIFEPDVREAAANLRIGDRVIVVTWLHQGHRDILSVHPRDDLSRPLEGVFSTRSSDRPNPIGLHTVTIIGIRQDELTVDHLEAIDGTPVLDIKPVLGTVHER